LHPGSKILIYVLAALVIPGLSFFLLTICAVGALASIVWQGRRPLRLIWRTRWLILVLVLGYGFSVPGEGVSMFLGEWAPTRQGLALGAERALHLTVLLLWLDALVLSLSSEQLLSGLHALMRPLAGVGVDTGRIALRLALTLKAIERLERGEDRADQGLSGNLGRLFDPVSYEWMPAQAVLRHYPLRGRDVLVPLLLLAGFGVLAWSGGWR